MRSSRTRTLFSCCGLLAAMSVAVPVAAQDPPPDDPQPPAGRPGGQGRPGGRGPQQAAGPRKYEDVITEKAKTEKGIFTVHRIEDKVYFEIPADALNREMLWQTEIAQVPTGFGYGGTAVGSRVIRWTRRNNKIFLRTVSYRNRASGEGAIQRAIADASLEPIIMAFDVEAENKEKEPVIDVTRLITTDVSEFAAKGRLGAASVDATRSYVDKVKAFPNNVEMRSLLTFNLSPAGPPTPGGGGPPGPGRRGGGRPGGASSVSATIHYSMVMLPEKPMMGRLSDSRVGFFTEGFEDFGTDENRVVDRAYVARYNLVKKDPSAAVSEPVKPIVYYISREVPEKWRPYVKKGVEDWNEAFEVAGFKSAVVCKEAPSEKDDPNWDPEDARYSVIRWAPQAVSNAMGPHVHDPRSGEILNAHIIVWHDVLKLAQTWYFVQCSPLDTKAQKLPLADDLMGELMRYVVCHEVGHTLGLRHNHKASSSYTIAQLRSKEFTEKYGNEASIMDYGRFNYVAQPGDNARLIPKLGPYDRFAIEWGYKSVGNFSRPEDEKAELDKIAARQVNDATLRFGGEDEEAISDPTVQSEDLGNDPIEATYLGLKNINRVVPLLIPATTKFGEDYDLLNEMYDQLHGQRQRELGHVAKLIGGVAETDYHAGRGGEVFKHVPKAKQAEAMQFLLANAFQTPKDLLVPAILNRIEPSGVADRVLNGQRGLLTGLLAEARVKRMIDNQALNGPQAYTVLQMVTELQAGVWSELNQPNPTVDLYRRNLQRAYIQTVKSRVTGDSAAQNELKPILLGALRDLAATIDKVAPKTTDKNTKLHLQDSRAEIERILNPKS